MNETLGSQQEQQRLKEVWLFSDTIPRAELDRFSEINQLFRDLVKKDEEKRKPFLDLLKSEEGLRRVREVREVPDFSH